MKSLKISKGRNASKKVGNHCNRRKVTAHLTEHCIVATQNPAHCTWNVEGRAPFLSLEVNFGVFRKDRCDVSNMHTDLKCTRC